MNHSKCLVKEKVAKDTNEFKVAWIPVVRKGKGGFRKGDVKVIHRGMTTYVPIDDNGIVHFPFMEKDIVYYYFDVRPTDGTCCKNCRYSCNLEGNLYSCFFKGKVSGDDYCVQGEISQEKDFPQTPEQWLDRAQGLVEGIKHFKEGGMV